MNRALARRCAWCAIALVAPVVMGCTQIPKRPPTPEDETAMATQPRQTPTPPPEIRATPAPAPDRQVKQPNARNIDLSTATCPTPNYPPYAQDQEATGVTRVQFSVNAAGYVTEARVVQTSGATPAHKVLDQTAATTALACRFPAAEGFGPAQAVRSFRWTLE